MGNSISYQFNMEDDSESYDSSADEVMQVDNLILNIVGTYHQPSGAKDMPVIRKRPDLRAFRRTPLYVEVKALSGLPADKKRPNDRWSLHRGLMRRENGLAARNGTFTENQQRRIANLYVPNKKDSRLMSLEAKVFISRFNKDGSKLITASQKSLVRVTDSSKGTYHLIKRIKVKEVSWSILDVDFSPCGNYFAYCTWSDYFFVVPLNGNVDESQWVDLNPTLSRCGIFSIRFSPDGRKIIGGCSDSRIYINDREKSTVSHIETQRNALTDINAVSFISDTDPNVFVSGCNNGIIKMWDLRTERRSCQPVSTFLGHFDGITYIDSRGDGNYILSNSKDQSIKLFDLRKPSPCEAVNRTPKAPLIDWDYRWDSVPREYYNLTAPMEGQSNVMTYRGHRVTKTLIRARFSPTYQTGNRYIYTGCGTGRIIIYDMLTGQIKEAIEGHKDVVRDLDWHPIRSEIVSSSWDTHVNLNTFKFDLLNKRVNTDSQSRLRRSRRIAYQNGELDESEVEDDIITDW